MEILQILTDLGLVIGTVVIVAYIVHRQKGPPGEVISVSLFTVTVMVTTFIILYQYRFVAAGLVILFFIGVTLWTQLGMIRPWERKIAEITDYYVENLTRCLSNYKIVWVTMYGLEEPPEKDAPKQIYLFVDHQDYLDVLDGYTLSNLRWEYFKIDAKPDSRLHPDALYLVMLMDRENAPPVALTMHGAMIKKTPKEDHPPYDRSSAWSLALSYLLSGAQLTLYAMPSHHEKTLRDWNEDPRYHKDHNERYMRYFHEHLADQPHIRLTPPEFPQAWLDLVEKQEWLDKRQGQVRRYPAKNASQGYIYPHDKIGRSRIETLMREARGN